MNDTDLVTIEFVLSPLGVSDVKDGRPPGSGNVRITTADGTERYELEQFMYSVNQFIEAVPELLEGGCSGVSSVDTLYIVLERKDDSRGHITVCIGRDALLNPERRLPRERRSLDAVVPLPVLVNAVLTALTDFFEHMEEINENVDDCEWYQELRADFEDTRELAANHLQ